MSATDPDAALVRDLYADDPERRRRALAELFERHHRRVYTVAYRTLGRADLAEDVTQEVFLQLSDHAATWRGESGFLSWLYRVTLNRAIDERRREKRHLVLPMTEDSDAGARRPRGDAPETDPSSRPDRTPWPPGCRPPLPSCPLVCGRSRSCATERGSPTTRSRRSPPSRSGR